MQKKQERLMLLAMICKNLGINFAKMTAQSWQKKLTTGIFLNAIKMRTLL